jgi:hypothetical protein
MLPTAFYQYTVTVTPHPISAHISHQHSTIIIAVRGAKDSALHLGHRRILNGPPHPSYHSNLQAKRNQPPPRPTQPSVLPPLFNQFSEHSTLPRPLTAPTQAPATAPTVLHRQLGDMTRTYIHGVTESSTIAGSAGVVSVLNRGLGDMTRSYIHGVVEDPPSSSPPLPECPDSSQLALPSDVDLLAPANDSASAGVAPNLDQAPSAPPLDTASVLARRREKRRRRKHEMKKNRAKEAHDLRRRQRRRARLDPRVLQWLGGPNNQRYARGMMDANTAAAMMNADGSRMRRSGGRHTGGSSSGSGRGHGEGG